MKHHVALLALAFEVGETFPVLKIFRACDACTGCCSGKVAGTAVVMTFYTEDAIDVAILMGGESHVVDVGAGNLILRHCDGVVAEHEIVDTVRTLRNCEEGFTVVPFHTHHKYIFILPFDCTGVEGGVYADTLHEIGVGLRIEVIFPEWGYHLGSHHGMCIACVDSVAVNGYVVACDECLVV